MAGLTRNPGNNALALVNQGVGLQAVSIDNVPATAKMSSWDAVSLPKRLISMGRVTLTLLILLFIIIEFIPWTQTVTATGKLSAREEDLPDFIDLLAHFDKSPQYQARLAKYGINRADERFWETYDWFQKRLLDDEPVYGGLFDLNRY